MRIKVETNGHQFYDSVEGEVVQWCSSVTHFWQDGKTIMHQVPAVLIDTGAEVKLVLLKADGYHSEIIKVADKASGSQNG